MKMRSIQRGQPGGFFEDALSGVHHINTWDTNSLVIMSQLLSMIEWILLKINSRCGWYYIRCKWYYLK